jgi:hypothetical protein
MKRRKFADGGETTEMEEGSGGYGALSEPEPAAEKPKVKPKAKPPGGTPGGAMRGQRAESPSPQRVEVTGKRAPKDDETKSVSERAKAARERARMGGTSTDDRSVTERMGGSERKGSSTSTDTRSLADRMKAMRESARSSTTGTDTRSVGERIRSTLGFANGGKVRGGGCERQGKTRGKFV